MKLDLQTERRAYACYLKRRRLRRKMQRSIKRQERVLSFIVVVLLGIFGVLLMTYLGYNYSVL